MPEESKNITMTRDNLIDPNKDLKNAIGLLQQQIEYLITANDKLTERFNGMGRAMVEGNKIILTKLDDTTKKDLLPKNQEPISSEHQDKLFEALCKAKEKMSVEFEKTGNSNRGCFATYPDLVYHARPFLALQGLDIIHEPLERENQDFLKTTIIHSSGQWRSSICAIRPDFEKGNKAPIQEYASALTSMKRYVYAAILNLHTGGEKD
jgi:hypothetical protein